MDSLNKATAGHNLFAALTRSLRILELCLALLLLSWILPRLPFALSFLRQFSLFLASPLFVFLLSNAIIATLLANSRRCFSPHDIDAPSHHFLTNSTSQPLPLLRLADGGVVYQDKEIVSHTNSADKADTPSEAGLDSDFPRVYRRSQSEKLKEEERPEPMQQKLRRSETRVENRQESMYPQDKLSNEEFQRTIEAFIAKQMRFLREESLAIVIQNQS